MLGGSVALHFPEHGVVASLVLPLQPSDGAPPPRLPTRLRLATLDDDGIVRFLDTERFRRLGIEAFVRGETTAEIVDFVSFVASLSPPPHAVLIDQNLDHHDLATPMVGTEMLPQLRAACPAAKLIIKSANQSSSDRQHYAACGADGSLDKVLSDQLFVAELSALLQYEAPTAPPCAVANTSGAESRRTIESSSRYEDVRGRSIDS